MATVDQIIATQTNSARAATSRGQAFLASLYGLARESVSTPNTNITSPIRGPGVKGDVTTVLGPPAVTNLNIINTDGKGTSRGGFSGGAPQVNINDVTQGSTADSSIERVADSDISATGNVAVDGNLNIASVGINISGVNVPVRQNINVIDDVNLDDIDYAGIDSVDPDEIDVEEESLSPDQEATLGTTGIDIEGFDVGTINTPDVPNFITSSINNQFNFFERGYSSSLLTLCSQLFESDLTIGGYGITVSDEQALFTRTRDRAASIYKDAGGQVARQFASRGFPMPPSAMQAAFQKAGDDYRKELSGSNREITLTRSDLYFKARQFALSEGVKLENMLLDYHNSSMERLLNAEKAYQEFAISIYELSFKKYELELDAFIKGVDATYRSIQAKVLQLENDKLKLQAEGLAIERDKLEISFMTARNQATESEARIIANRIQVSELKLKRSRLLLDEQKVLIDEYGQQISRQELSVRNYSAKISAEELTIKSDSLSLDAARINVDKASKQVDAEQRQNSISIDEGRYSLDSSKVEIDKLSQVANSRIAAYSSGISRLNSLISLDKLQLEAQKDSMSLRIDGARIDADIYKTDASSWTDSDRINASYDSAYKSAISSQNGTVMQASIADVRAATDLNTSLVAIERIRATYEGIFASSVAQVDTIELNKAIETVKSRVDSSENEARLAAENVRSISRGADVAAAEISGAMSSISAIAQKIEDKEEA